MIKKYTLNEFKEYIRSVINESILSPCIGNAEWTFIVKDTNAFVKSINKWETAYQDEFSFLRKMNKTEIEKRFFLLTSLMKDVLEAECMNDHEVRVMHPKYNKVIYLMQQCYSAMAFLMTSLITKLYHAGITSPSIKAVNNECFELIKKYGIADAYLPTLLSRIPEEVRRVLRDKSDDLIPLFKNDENLPCLVTLYKNGKKVYNAVPNKNSSKTDFIIRDKETDKPIFFSQMRQFTQFVNFSKPINSDPDMVARLTEFGKVKIKSKQEMVAKRIAKKITKAL